VRTRQIGKQRENDNFFENQKDLLRQVEGIQCNMDKVNPLAS
jgi:hypothetical protein